MASRTRPGWMDWLFDSGLERHLQNFNTWVYRRSNGKLGSYFGAYGGVPVCLLTTTGRKTGKPRTVPLLYLKEKGDDTVVLVASRGGTDKVPLWYRNLAAHPDVEVQIRSRVTAMRARTATPEEKQRLWPKLVDLYGPYDSYQAWSNRDIPVVILTPRPTD